MVTGYSVHGPLPPPPDDGEPDLADVHLNQLIARLESLRWQRDHCTDETRKETERAFDRARQDLFDATRRREPRFREPVLVPVGSPDGRPGPAARVDRLDAARSTEYLARASRSDLRPADPRPAGPGAAAGERVEAMGLERAHPPDPETGAVVARAMRLLRDRGLLVAGPYRYRGPRSEPGTEPPSSVAWGDLDTMDTEDPSDG